MRKGIGAFLVWLVVGATACTTSELSTEPAEVAAAESRVPSGVIGTWRGVIPCADCPGINYNLSLNEDNTFEETMIYQEREVEPYTRTGTWQIANGILQLSGNDSTSTQFDMSIGGELHMLDQEGKRINTSLGDKYKLKKDTDLTENKPEKHRPEIDFVATGNEPGWALEMDLEKGMYFKTLPNETIALDTPIQSTQKKGKTTIYKGTSENGDLIVELTAQPCEDTMSGKMSTHTVRVKAKGIEFNGCGTFLGTNSEEK